MGQPAVRTLRPQQPLSPTATPLLLAGLAVVALGVRLWGIGFSLPDTYHPDEPQYVLQALAVGRALPGGLTFANPPLYKEILLGEYAATYLLGHLTGAYASPRDFVGQFRAEPTLLYLEARLTSALAGALTALAAGVLGGLWSRRAGVLAAAWSAVAYLLVRESHFGVNDALVTLLVTLALVFCVRVVRGGGWRDDVLAGALAGLAFTAKYQGLAVLLPLVLANLLRRDRRFFGGGLARALAAMLVVVGASFPSLVVEPARVLGDVYLHLYLPGQVGYAGLDPAGGYLYYLKVLVWGLGWPLSLVAVAALGLGGLMAVRSGRRDPAWLVVASLPVALYAVLGAERMYFARLLLPGVPALLVLAAVFVDDLGRRAARRWQPSAAALLVPVVAGLLALPPLLDALRFDRLLTLPDTRAEARAWVEANLAPATRLAVDAAPLGPPLPADRYDLLVANGWSIPDRPLADYQAQGIEYLVTSSYAAEAEGADPALAAQRRAFYASLGRAAQVLAQFRPVTSAAEPEFVYDQIYGPFDGPGGLDRPGPTVTVYRLGPGERGDPTPRPAASS